MKLVRNALYLSRRPIPFLLVVMPMALIIGRLYPKLAPSFQSLGLAGLGLFLLPAFPIVVTSVITAFNELAKLGNDKSYLTRLFVITIIACCLSACIGILFSILWSAGVIDDNARTDLGQLLDQDSNVVNVYIRSEPPALAQGNAIDDYINRIIPSNLVKHLTDGETLKILVASAAFGISLSKIPSPLASQIEQAMIAINTVSTRLLETFLKVSPIIIFFLVAAASSTITYSTVSALIGLFAAVLSGCLLLLVIAKTVFSQSTHWTRKNTDSYKSMDVEEGTMTGKSAIQDTFMLGLTTSNSMALFANVRSALAELGFARAQIDTSVVVSLLLARAGNIIYNSSVIIFALNLYDVKLDFPLLITVLFLSILSGLAAAGLSGIASITVIVLALDSIQIPSGPVLVLVMSIDPLFVMLRAATTGVVSLSLGSLVCSRPQPALNH